MRKPLGQIYDDFFPEKEIQPEPEKSPEPAIENTIIGQKPVLEQLRTILQHPGAIVLFGGPDQDVKIDILTRMANELYQHKKLMKRLPAMLRLDHTRYGELFYQDLYRALATPSSMIIVTGISKADPLIIKDLTTLLKEGTLYLEGRYYRQDNRLMPATNILDPHLIDHLAISGHCFFILTDETIEKARQTLPIPFLNVIQEFVETIPYSEEEKKQRCARRIEKIAQNLKLEITIDPTITELPEDLEQRLKKLLVSKNPQAVHLTVKDGQLVANEEPLTDDIDKEKEIQACFDEIDQLTGLEEVKQYLYDLKDMIDLYQRREKAGLKNESLSLHAIFTGNPGTGKTTVARLLAKCLKALGMLKSGQLVEVSRPDLVAGYVGQTAIQTRKVMNAALGGVLFIDEAYALYRGKDDSFGLEAIDTLVKGMEDHRDELVVILAGYTKEMQEFLKANSGLASRFSRTIHFRDYSAKELLDIAMSQARSKDYDIAPEAKDKLLEYFTATLPYQATAGNGRLARNIIEDAILKQAARLAKSPDNDLITLKAEDFVFKDDYSQAG